MTGATDRVWRETRPYLSVRRVASGWRVEVCRGGRVVWSEVRDHPPRGREREVLVRVHGSGGNG